MLVIFPRRASPEPKCSPVCELGVPNANSVIELDHVELIYQGLARGCLVMDEHVVKHVMCDVGLALLRFCEIVLLSAQ